MPRLNEFIVDAMFDTGSLKCSQEGGRTHIAEDAFNSWMGGVETWRGRGLKTFVVVLGWVPSLQVNAPFLFFSLSSFYFFNKNPMFAGSWHRSEAPTAQLDRSPTQRRPCPHFNLHRQPLLTVGRPVDLKLFFLMYFVPTKAL